MHRVLSILELALLIYRTSVFLNTQNKIIEPKSSFHCVYVQILYPANLLLRLSLFLQCAINIKGIGNPVNHMCPCQHCAAFTQVKCTAPFFQPTGHHLTIFS